MADTITERNTGNPRARSGWNVAFGLWLIAAPFVLGYSMVTQAMQNDIAVGIIVFVLALVGTSASGARWSRIVNILAGIWLFIAPFVLGYAATTMNAVWNDLILGALVIIFGSISLSSATKYHHAHHRHAYQ